MRRYRVYDCIVCISDIIAYLNADKKDKVLEILKAVQDAFIAEYENAE